MHWIDSMMWAFCRGLGTVLTFVGLAGLMYFAGRGLAWFYNKILNEE